MAERPISQRGRKWRLLRDAVILLLTLVFLSVTLDFPMFTAEQALRATQTRYYWEDGQVVADLGSGPLYDRQYLLRMGNWYAWCGLSREGLLWDSGTLVSLYRDPEQPLSAVTPHNLGAVLVLAGDPDIVQVEVEYPVLVSESDAGMVYGLNTLRQGPAADGCFWFQLTGNLLPAYYMDRIRLRGYDADGRLIYQSPEPEPWTTRYELR